MKGTTTTITTIMVNTVTIHRTPMITMATTMPRLAMGKHLGHPLVQSGRMTELDIRCDTGLPLAADGEWLGLASKVQV